MITIQIEDDVVLAALNRMTGILDDTTPIMNDIAERLLVSTKDRFQKGKAPDGSVWAPNSPVTFEAQRRRGDNPDPRPLFGPGKRLSTNIFRQSGDGWAEIGSDAIQAAVMHFGAQKGEFGQAANDSPIPWGDIPARPFLGFSDEDRDEIGAVVHDWITRAWNNE